MKQPTPPTILIIDNDPCVVRALTARLESLGYLCRTAGTGAQGLAEFNSGSIDLVISDLNMPEGDGITLAQSIRRISPVPIIFISGFKDEFKRRLRDIPNVSLLRKPFKTQDLIDLMEAELGRAPVNCPANGAFDSISQENV
jgi:DNA-binding response OmpR family regulator